MPAYCDVVRRPSVTVAACRSPNRRRSPPQTGQVVFQHFQSGRVGSAGRDVVRFVQHPRHGHAPGFARVPQTCGSGFWAPSPTGIRPARPRHGSGSGWRRPSAGSADGTRRITQAPAWGATRRARPSMPTRRSSSGVSRACRMQLWRRGEHGSTGSGELRLRAAPSGASSLGAAGRWKKLRSRRETGGRRRSSRPAELGRG